jgi:hypothetical protein
MNAWHIARWVLLVPLGLLWLACLLRNLTVIVRIIGGHHSGPPLSVLPIVGSFAGMFGVRWIDWDIGWLAVFVVAAPDLIYLIPLPAVLLFNRRESK